LSGSKISDSESKGIAGLLVIFLGAILGIVTLAAMFTTRGDQYPARVRECQSGPWGQFQRLGDNAARSINRGWGDVL